MTSPKGGEREPVKLMKTAVINSFRRFAVSDEGVIRPRGSLLPTTPFVDRETKQGWS